MSGGERGEQIANEVGKRARGATATHTRCTTRPSLADPAFDASDALRSLPPGCAELLCESLASNPRSHRSWIGAWISEFQIYERAQAHAFRAIACLASAVAGAQKQALALKCAAAVGSCLSDVASQGGDVGLRAFPMASCLSTIR